MGACPTVHVDKLDELHSQKVFFFLREFFENIFSPSPNFREGYPEISDIKRDLKDGLALHRLLEIASGKFLQSK